MTEPLELSFEVACPVAHAFDTWTRKIGSWWPADHTVSGAADAEIVLEPRAGGRIYERTAEGVEHEWGEVTLWEHPHRLGYLWHLRRDRADATAVGTQFLAAGAATRVRIEHVGWERLGQGAEEWRTRNQIAWRTLLPFYRNAIERSWRRWRKEPKPIPGS
jgi:hypothetical protein